MPQETAETVRGVRIPLVPETRRHRSLDERIVVRFPALARLYAAWWARLPQHSRLRRALLLRRLRQGYAAANRRDFDLLLTGLDPRIEYHPSEAWQIKLDPLYHGHDGYLEVWRDLLESFENVRLDPEELLDTGDRFLITVKMSSRGAGSGVFLSQPHFQLYTLRQGLVVRQHDFVDRVEALKAVGLSE
jgi:hypothetical protein